MNNTTVAKAIANILDGVGAPEMLLTRKDEWLRVRMACHASGDVGPLWLAVSNRGNVFFEHDRASGDGNDIVRRMPAENERSVRGVLRDMIDELGNFACTQEFMDDATQFVLECVMRFDSNEWEQTMFRALLWQQDDDYRPCCAQDLADYLNDLTKAQVIEADCSDKLHGAPNLDDVMDAWIADDFHKCESEAPDVADLNNVVSWDDEQYVVRENDEAGYGVRDRDDVPPAPVAVAA